MWIISKKELSQFFSSLTGYIAMVIFLLVCGIFLFVLPQSSLFEYGYASLDKFFELAPWVLMFLLPAICMRSFSEEFRSGTFETLKTRPLTNCQIVWGKYLAIIIVSLFVIIPTAIYIITIKLLSSNGTIDSGGISGSYLGLFLLAAVYAAISICCSSFTQNAIVSFLVSVSACLVMYFGFSAISRMPALQGSADYYIEMLGIDFHYRSISRGVLDTRDVIYFFSVIFFSLLVTVKMLNKR